MRFLEQMAQFNVRALHARRSRSAVTFTIVALTCCLVACSDDSSKRGSAGALPSGDSKASGEAAADGGGSDSCERDQIAGLIDKYLKAMTAHDPSGLPLASSLRFTENAADTELGEGFWKTAGEAQFHRDLIDVERCSSVTQAVIDEDGKQIIFAMRLKLERQKLSEIETIVVRGEGIDSIWFVPQMIIDKQEPEWDEIVPAEERSTREELEGLAAQYFDLFEHGDISQYPFGEGCSRLENGLLTTRTSGCPAGIMNGGMITERRFPVTDVERGTTVGCIMFMGMFLDFHLFKVRDGKVDRIQAVLTSQVAGMESGWK